MATTDFNKKNSNSLNFNHSQPTIIECPQNSYIRERSYCETLQKNKPQSNSVGGGENEKL